MELLCENRAELFHDTNEVSYIIKRAASNIDYDSVIFVNNDTPCEIILLEHNVDDNTRSSAMKVKVTSEILEENHLIILSEMLNITANYWVVLKYVEHYIIPSLTEQKPNITVIYSWKEWNCRWIMYNIVNLCKKCSLSGVSNIVILEF